MPNRPYPSVHARMIASPAGTRWQRLAPASIWLVALLVTACAGPLAVPERQLTLRVDLPLTPNARERVVLFIAAGGRLGDGGTLVQPIPAVEAEFGSVLDVLGGAAALRLDEFEGRLRQAIPAAEQSRLVIDATEEYPDEVGRVAYLLRNFWFVFYAQKESDAGPLPAREWRLTRLAVFRDRSPT
jgi:hypothetical protein